MLSRETLENYRRMTPGERLRLTLDLTKDAAKSLLHGTQAQVAKRFELLEQQNNARTLAICEGLAKTRIERQADEVNGTSTR